MTEEQRAEVKANAARITAAMRGIDSTIEAELPCDLRGLVTVFIDEQDATVTVQRMDVGPVGYHGPGGLLWQMPCGPSDWEAADEADPS